MQADRGTASARTGRLPRQARRRGRARTTSMPKISPCSILEMRAWHSPVKHLLDECITNVYPGGMATSQVAFRPTEEDRRIIESAKRPDEGVTDVIRRALRLLAREDWLRQARGDAERLADEDLSVEQDAW
jgi:hypothetical protein